DQSSRMPAHRHLGRSAMAGTWVLHRVNEPALPQKRGSARSPQDDEQRTGESMRRIRRIGIVGGLPMLLIALFAAAAWAVAPGTYTPTADSFNSANAPGSSHLASGSPSCTVNADLSIDCSAYVLGGVGNTNATVALSATYSAIIDCFNKGTNKNNPVESHTADFSASSTATVASTRNGQLRVPTQDVSPFEAPQVCPNPNWSPEIRAGSTTVTDS